MSTNMLKNVIGLLKMISVIIGLPLLAWALAYFYDEGYLGFYWERYEAVYDPELKINRCIGENGELMEGLQSPCAALTMRGIKARERHFKECLARGGESDRCESVSEEWLDSYRPRIKYYSP